MIHRAIALDGELPVADVAIALVVDDRTRRVARRLREAAQRLRNREARGWIAPPETVISRDAVWLHNEESAQWELHDHGTVIATATDAPW